MELAKYEKVQKLGNGYFGEVWKVKRDPPSSEWQVAAMKIIKNPGVSAWNEVEFLKKSQHECVIKYYDSFKCVNSGHFGRLRYWSKLLLKHVELFSIHKRKISTNHDHNN